MCQRRQWLNEHGLVEQQEPYDDHVLNKPIIEYGQDSGQCDDCGYPTWDCICHEGGRRIGQ